MVGMGYRIFYVRVTDKGFISFAAEKVGRKKGSVGAAKVMKPGSELNLGGEVDL